MKKTLALIMIAALALTASCGRRSSAPSPSPSAAVTHSPKPGTTGAPESANGDESGAAEGEAENASPNGENQGSESGGTRANGDAEPNAEQPESEPEKGAPQSGEVSVINASSVPFYAVYLASNADGNPGENIIGDTPLGEGEEIVIPFADAPDSLTVIVEDENGRQYSAGGISLADGLTIELSIDGGVLSANVQ